jgi:hypothetical protein
MVEMSCTMKSEGAYAFATIAPMYQSMWCHIQKEFSLYTYLLISSVGLI